MEEDWKYLNAQKKSASWKESVALLLKDFSNTTDKQLHAKEPIETDNKMDTCSDAGMYHSISEQTQTADWVGPVTANVKCWEPSASGPSCLPYIWIGDVIPPNLHREFQNFDASRRGGFGSQGL
ncbi:hypothetical protein MPDQ_003578 [Monascus purpureus]|uniref:Uncharacterized protein n=1 Tax=Monascus purpureus TaxID=5098 RepID=A0A507QMM6_MONPU|nr:hypothetical protein MPDQ_003578 [Monascus purpureus]